MLLKKQITINTKKTFDIVDITEEVSKFLNESGVHDWLINVFTRHTTAALKINEAEDWLRHDLENRCNKNVSIDDEYKHDDLENRDPKTMCDIKTECINWFAHVREMLMLQASETIPVENGKMLLWRRQKILFIEMDHSRERNIIFTFMWE